MKIEQIYTGCLAQGAYYITSKDEAIIIDPLREIMPYRDRLKRDNVKLKYIFETHFHADFVSGHLDLSIQTGAKIVYGPNAATDFDFISASDGQLFDVGNIKVKAIHTPGHTMESTTFLLIDENGKDHAIFSGDTLFVGDVGRPDLSQKGEILTTNDLAAMLYDSLQSKIMPLSNDVIVYPAHGAGSSCGKSLGPETFSTIGEQKQNNYALNQDSKEDFVKAVTDGLAAPPNYFPINAMINKQGYESLDSVVEEGLKPLTVAQVKAFINDDEVILLDTRPASVFTQGFVPNSIFIGLEGRFAEWAGSLLSFTKKIILITEKDKEKETIIRLARVGFSKFLGHLDGGFEAWETAGEKIDLIIDIEADELAMDLPFDPKAVIVDVRKETEFGDGHLAEAVNLPLVDLVDPASMADLEDNQNIYVHCAGGYRSVIAASMIKQQGIHNLRNVLGGWGAIKELKDKFQIEKSAEVLI